MMSRHINSILNKAIKDYKNKGIVSKVLIWANGYTIHCFSDIYVVDKDMAIQFIKLFKKQLGINIKIGEAP